LFVAVNSVPLSGEQAIAAASLRQVIEAKGVLVWQHPRKLTEHHIAAAIEAAWQLALVSLSTQEGVQSQQYYDLILAELARKPAKLTPDQSVAELPPPQQVLSLCKTIAVTSNKDLGEGFECTLFELSQAELSQVEMCQAKALHSSNQHVLLDSTGVLLSRLELAM